MVFIVCKSSVTHTMPMGMDFCSEIERPLARFELERTREQKKPYLAKCTGVLLVSTLSEHLTPQNNTCHTGFIFQRCSGA